MNGSLIALLGRNVDCSPDIDEGEQLEGIADSGGSFELVTADDHPDIDDGASISVPRDVICRSQGVSLPFILQNFLSIIEYLLRREYVKQTLRPSMLFQSLHRINL